MLPMYISNLFNYYQQSSLNVKISFITLYDANHNTSSSFTFASVSHNFPKAIYFALVKCKVLQSACLHISNITRPNSTEFTVYDTCGHGSAFRWWQCASSFVVDVMLLHNGIHGRMGQVKDNMYVSLCRQAAASSVTAACFICQFPFFSQTSRLVR